MRGGIYWIFSVALINALSVAACGRDDPTYPSNQAMSSPSALTGASQDLVCTGPSTDDTRTLRVLAYKDQAKHYGRVVIEDVSIPDDPRTISVLEDYRDTTPPPPTDIQYRLVFGTDVGFSVMLVHGGYTQQATVEIKQDAQVVGWQTCRRPPAP